jgi:hypothetical protein
LETKKSKNYDNKDNGKRDIENNNNTSSGQYTFDSSDPKEIMTGVGGGEGEENSTYPNSDKYIVDDIKKAIKEKNIGIGEEEEEQEENSFKSDSEQSNNNDENN